MIFHKRMAIKEVTKLQVFHGPVMENHWPSELLAVFYKIGISISKRWSVNSVAMMVESDVLLGPLPSYLVDRATKPYYTEI